MKRDLIYDYLSYTALKFFGPLVRMLPVEMTLFLGRAIGSLIFYFDARHRALVYAHLRKAFADKMTPQQLIKIAKAFYQNIGQSIMEIFLIPLVDKEYMRKHIDIVGKSNIDEGFKRGKGVLLLGVHAGSWELSNIISANLAFPFCLFVRHQRYPRLNRLLNYYRTQKGCKIITRQNQTRDLIESMRENRAIGMTADQGGKSGTRVEFLGKDASMSTGAIRIALKYDVTLLPAFYARVGGANHRVIIEPPFMPDKLKDIRENLQALVRLYEKNILQHPQEYLWTYKIWKYGRQQEVLILSDGKAGHLRQAQAAANIAKGCFAERGINIRISTVEVKFKNQWSKSGISLSSVFSGKYNCQGCLWCLKVNLSADTYNTLMHMSPDMIISCGASVAPINFILSRENLAKSVVIMRPSLLSARRFDLVIMPQHDRPPKRKNLLVTQGALNLIDREYLAREATALKAHTQITKDTVIGLLIGGESKNFHLGSGLLKEVISQIKLSAQNLDAQILVTTSRRTCPECEELAKREFQDYPRCRLLVIANEKNIPQAVGGILGLSNIVITSPESISMISEAVNSQKYVFVFNGPGLSKKHQRFLRFFEKNKYIYLVGAHNLSSAIEEVWRDKPPAQALKDNLLVAKAIKKIL